MTEDEDFAASFNELTGSAPSSGGGMELPAEAVEAAREDGGGATDAGESGALADRVGDVTDVNDKTDGGASSEADNAGGESTTTNGDGVVEITTSASTPEGGDTDTPDLTVDVSAPASEDPGAAAADNDGDDEPTDPKDIQRKKSWEGRLKADERRLAEERAELQALAAKLGAKDGDDDASPASLDDAAAVALDGVAENAEGASPELADEAGQLAGQVDRGEISGEEAIKLMSADFGDEFTNLLRAAIKSEAKKLVDGVVGSRFDEISSKVEALGADRDAVIEHISNENTRRHFEQLAAAKPNFAEVNADPAFDAFVQEKGADAEAIRTGGSVQQIVELINEFEKTRSGPADEAAAPDEVAAAPAAAARPVPETVGASDQDIDEAMAVRGGGGMSLPDEPKGKDDYAGTWNDIPERPVRRA